MMPASMELVVAAVVTAGPARASLLRGASAATVNDRHLLGQQPAGDRRTAAALSAVGRERSSAHVADGLSVNGARARDG
jgi:hypothetical protein